MLVLAGLLILTGYDKRLETTLVDLSPDSRAVEAKTGWRSVATATSQVRALQQGRIDRANPSQPLPQWG